MKPLPTLLERSEHPIHGKRISWYVHFVMYRAMIINQVVIHNVEEYVKLAYSIHYEACLNEAIDNGWIQSYQLVRSKTKYPFTIKSIRLHMYLKDGRTIWKRLLGNKCYNNLHHFMQELSRDTAESPNTIAVQKVEDVNYYTRKYKQKDTPNAK